MQVLVSGVLSVWESVQGRSASEMAGRPAEADSESRADARGD